MNTVLQPIAEPTIFPAGRWTVDPRHSSVDFAVKHLMIATIKGRFHDFEGALEVGEAGAEVRAHGTVKVESVDTGTPERDAHLLSPDFFDVDRYPEIRFLLLGFRATDGGGLRAIGELTMRGVTRQIVLEGAVGGTARDSSGGERLALELTGQLSRHDFGLRWNELLDGSSVVGDAVRVAIDLSLVRRAERGGGFPRFERHQRPTGRAA
jgi:polyisoprenoid-binding protein YceI